jgi:hypothetical protein
MSLSRNWPDERAGLGSGSLAAALVCPALAPLPHSTLQPDRGCGLDPPVPFVAPQLGLSPVTGLSALRSLNYPSRQLHGWSLVPRRDCKTGRVLPGPRLHGARKIDGPREGSARSAVR